MRTVALIDALFAPSSPRVTDRAKLLYLSLHRWRRRHPHRRHWPTRQEFARGTLGLEPSSVSAVGRALRELRAHRMVTTRQRQRGPSEYTLHPPREWKR